MGFSSHGPDLEAYVRDWSDDLCEEGHKGCCTVPV